MAKVTAIVSAYYAETYLLGRLKNLATQLPRPEIIVICQRGSKEEVIAHDARVVDAMIVTENIPTIYDAWNMGIEKATGEYLTNANCDDRLYPGTLQAMAGLLDKNPQYAAVYSDVDIVEEVGGAPVRRFTWAEGDLNVLMEGCFMGPMPMWRKSLHEKYGPFDAEMRSSGDYEFWLRLSAAGEKFFHIKQPMGAYLKHKDNLEHRESLRSIWETARARTRYGGNWL